MTHGCTRRGLLRARLLVTLLLSSSASGATLEEQALALFEQGNRLYLSEDHEGARHAYEGIVALGVESSAIYFNLGNAAVKTGDIGRAVWAYARAHRLDPGDGDIRANLGYARALRADAVPKESASRLLELLASVTGRADAGAAVRLAIVIYWLLAVVAAVWLATRWRSLRVAANAIAVLLALTLLFAATKRVVDGSREVAVVLPESVAVKSAPGDEGRTVFTLHAGAEVRLDRALGGWMEISLGTELKGWLPEEALAVI